MHRENNGMGKVETRYIIARNDSLGYLGQQVGYVKIRWVSEPLAARRFATAEDAIKFAAQNFPQDTVYIGKIKIKSTYRDEYH